MTAQRIPTSGPSAKTRSKDSRTSNPSTSSRPAEEAAGAVDEHDDVGQGRPLRGRHRPSPLELAAEVAHEAGLSLPVARDDDAAAVREAGEHAQLAGAVIQGVEVQRLRGPRAGERDRHGQQRGGGTAAADAEDGEVAVGGAPPGRHPALPVRVVGHGDGDEGRSVVVGRIARWRARHVVEVALVDARRQRVGPRPTRERAPGGRPGVDARVDELLEIGRSVGSAAGRARRSCSWSEGERAQLDRRARRRSRRRHERGLHRDDLARAEADTRPAGTVPRQAGGVGNVDDVGRVGHVLHPQRDAEVGVGAEVIGHGAGRPLGGEHEVDAEAAAPLGDADEGVDEVGELGLERGELVDHDDEPRQRLGGGGQLPVAGEVGRPDGAQQPFPMAELCFEAPERPLGEVGVEVGDEPDGVRQPGAGVEGAAALEVDEDEREVVGVGAGGEAGDERAEQLALAGAGRAGDEPVRPVGDEVELEHAVGRDAQRRRRARVGAGGGPAPSQLLGIGVVESEQRQEPDRVGQPGAAAVELGVVEAGEGAGGAPGGRFGEARRSHGRETPAQRRQSELGVAVLAVEPHHRRAHRGEAVDRRGDDDAGHRPGRAGQEVAQRSAAPLEQGVAVDDGEQRRPDAASLARLPHPVALAGGLEDRVGKGIGVGTPGRQPAPRTARIGDVRQPLRPVPVVDDRSVARHEDGEVGGTVVHRGLHAATSGRRRRPPARDPTTPTTPPPASSTVTGQSRQRGHLGHRGHHVRVSCGGLRLRRAARPTAPGRCRRAARASRRGPAAAPTAGCSAAGRDGATSAGSGCMRRRRSRSAPAAERERVAERVELDAPTGGVAPPALRRPPPGLEVAADGEHRREQGEDGEDGVAEDDHHHAGHEQRGEHGDDAERQPGPGRRRRLRHLDRRGGRRQRRSGRAVVRHRPGDGRPARRAGHGTIVDGRRQRDVGGAESRRGARGDLRRRPGADRGLGRAVGPEPRPVARGEVAERRGAVGADAQLGVPARDAGIADHDVGPRVTADDDGPRSHRRARPGVETTDDGDGDRVGRFRHGRGVELDATQHAGLEQGALRIGGDAGERTDGHAGRGGQVGERGVRVVGHDLPLPTVQQHLHSHGEYGNFMKRSSSCR